MSKLDPQKHVKPEQRPGSNYQFFTLMPGVVFPVTIARILEVIKTGEFPQELVDNNATPEADPRGVARLYLADAISLPREAWAFALKPKESFSSPAEISLRAEALNIARLWFTQALHVSVGGNGVPLGVHWTKDPGFRS